MAEFGFHAQPTEWPAILGQVLSVGGLEIIRNDCFPTRKVPRLVRVTPALLSHIATVNKLVFVRGDFTALPIRVFQLDAGKCKGTYVVDAATGGPLIELSLPSLVHKPEIHGGRPTLIPGDLFLNSRYGYEHKPGYFRPSAAAKAAFAKIKRALQAYLNRALIADRRIWIGPDALTTFEEGRAQILINGKYYHGVDRSGRVRRPAPSAEWRGHEAQRSTRVS